MWMHRPCTSPRPPRCCSCFSDLATPMTSLWKPRDSVPPLANKPSWHLWNFSTYAGRFLCHGKRSMHACAFGKHQQCTRRLQLGGPTSHLQDHPLEASAVCTGCSRKPAARVAQAGPQCCAGQLEHPNGGACESGVICLPIRCGVRTSVH